MSCVHLPRVFPVPKPLVTRLYVLFVGSFGPLVVVVRIRPRCDAPTTSHDPPHPRRQHSTLCATEGTVLSRVCLLFSKISNLQRLRLLGIILTSGIRYRLCSSKVVPSATRTYKARSYLAYD
jgi:hypothetical protein